jgi:deoxycytidylate deaminase
LQGTSRSGQRIQALGPERSDNGYSSNRLISVGYNGLARGVEDTDERLNNRELKYKIIVHCERNAIIFAQRNLEGCTLYTWPFMSCATCAAMVIQAGIKRCVAPASDNPRWQEDFKLTRELFREAGVELVEVECSENILTTSSHSPVSVGLWLPSAD